MIRLAVSVSHAALILAQRPGGVLVALAPSAACAVHLRHVGGPRHELPSSWMAQGMARPSPGGGLEGE